MKNLMIVSLLLISSAFISSCAKERVQGCTDPYALNFNPDATDNDGSCWVPIQTKKVLMGDFTATWCGPCGDWGAPAFKDAVDLTYGRVEAMAIHSTDEMSNTVTEELLAYYDITGIPTLRVWEQGQDFSDGASMASAVDQELLDRPSPEAGAIINLIDNGQKITLQVSAGVFAQTTGDYFVAAYIMQDSLKYPQNGAGEGGDYDPNFIHNHVLRASANGTWGEQFVYGVGIPGQVKTMTYNVDKEDGYDMKNVYALAVIWKYVKDQSYGEFKYEFVNVISSRDLVTQ